MGNCFLEDNYKTQFATEGADSILFNKMDCIDEWGVEAPEWFGIYEITDWVTKRPWQLMDNPGLDGSWGVSDWFGQVANLGYVIMLWHHYCYCPAPLSSPSSSSVYYNSGYIIDGNNLMWSVYIGILFVDICWVVWACGIYVTFEEHIWCWYPYDSGMVN